jgi:hypothetical protein
MRLRQRFPRILYVSVFLVVLVGALLVAQLRSTNDSSVHRLGLGDPAAAAGPAVTIEAPFDTALNSHPRDHHRMVNARDAETGLDADWAEDLAAGAGASVTPRLNGPYGTEYSVIDVFPACRTGAEGGQAVKVEIRAPNGGEVIGWVVYGHLGEVRVSEGQMVYNDTVLGTIGDGFPYCWTAPHLHLEAYNEAQHACYYEVGAAIPAGTPLGRLGGDNVGAPRSVCP